MIPEKKDNIIQTFNEKDISTVYANKLLIEKEKEIQKLKKTISSKDNYIRRFKKYEKVHNSIPLRAARFIRRKLRIIKKTLKKIKPIEKLIVPTYAEPIVSIIIPVKNQFNYTYACIKSILDTVENTPYEIIIGDDCSNDKTAKIKKYIKGIKVIINKSDQGFVTNCNNAAGHAAGEYILFLNNDTKVKPEWLSSMVDLMESDSQIGIVGSKLLYTNKKMQEAGGIVFSDGSAWNYGKNYDPNKPEYNYVKEVDYISGASLMIRKSLWNEIGGFDKRFAPAYYEDTDLAFSVRKAGYKVVYQPKSQVIHYEGKSNGTDVYGNNLKSYQPINHKKFFDKWENVLKKQVDDKEDLFLARDRSKEKKIVLFIDHQVLSIDQDAGSISTFSYMKVFMNMGYTVKFIADNYYKREPYTTMFQQMGIEVLYGDWYRSNWRTWLDTNGKYFDVVFVNRPDVSIKYIDILREKTNAHIIYYGHDLHHIREQRQYELSGECKLLESAARHKAIEYCIMDKADTIFYPSYIEINRIVNEHPEYRDKARAIPVYVFDDLRTSKIKPSVERSDIMFIGGFNHRPNVDAVIWFVKDILPKILEKHPDIVFHILGSNPKEEILELESKNVVIHGFVTKEELDEMYCKTRLVVVPLRYGAGMKGKVVEALYHNMPIITTSIGAEGMPEADDVMFIKDTAEEFAMSVNDLYSNYECLDKMAKKTNSYIEKYFSLDVAQNIVTEMLNRE